MKYAVVTIEWLAQHGLLAIPTMRKSKDGSKVILHEEFLTPYKDEEFPIYYFDSPELNDLLTSEEWSWAEEERPEGSAEFIRVAAAQNLLNITKAGIQTMSLTDNEALKVKSMYPYWMEFIGKSLTTGMKVQYNDGLYRVRQDIAVVLENQPPSIDTAALYEEINESAAGTIDDPIPYNNNMELFEGKYYSQGDVTYKCIRSTGQAVYANLSELVGIYVEVV
jgi:hypothetical protein|nr:MAG TPA: hypothetical protein [Caudoviricetes sp.]DAT18743.1 MAG TPA: hypothetical protein [Caudoviricetes sp.]